MERLDEKTKQVVEMYSQYPYPFGWNHNNAFANFLLPVIKEIGGIRTILDAGCGTGNSAIDIARHLPDVEITAIDITEKSLEIARERTEALGIKNIKFKCINLLEYDNSLGNFDFIHCQGVIHHLTDAHLGIKNLNRYLVNDGYAYIWLYALLGKQRILEIREALAILGVKDMEWKKRMQITEFITDIFKEGRRPGLLFYDGNPGLTRPINSKFLKNLEVGINVLNEQGWVSFINKIYGRFCFVMKKLFDKSSDKVYGYNQKHIGLVDEVLHPQDIFYRINDIFKMFNATDFHFIRILEGMSNSIEDSFGQNCILYDLVRNLPEEIYYQLIELYEKPSGIGFLVQKNKCQ